MTPEEALIVIHNLLPESVDDVIRGIAEEDELFDGLEASYSELLAGIWAILNSFPPGVLEDSDDKTTV